MVQLTLTIDGKVRKVEVAQQQQAQCSRLSRCNTSYTVVRRVQILLDVFTLLLPSLLLPSRNRPDCRVCSNRRAWECHQTGYRCKGCKTPLCPHLGMERYQDYKIKVPIIIQASQSINYPSIFVMVPQHPQSTAAELQQLDFRQHNIHVQMHEGLVLLWTRQAEVACT